MTESWSSQIFGIQPANQRLFFAVVVMTLSPARKDGRGERRVREEHLSRILADADLEATQLARHAARRCGEGGCGVQRRSGRRVRRGPSATLKGQSVNGRNLMFVKSNVIRSSVSSESARAGFRRRRPERRCRALGATEV